MIKRMKLALLAMAMLAGGSASAQYQLANGTFDGDFVDCYPWEKGAQVKTAYGKQPEGWCISNVPNSMAKSMASQVEGKNGKAIKITNTSAMSNGIPAYLTLGTTWATAETKMTSTRNKDGGLFGGVAFTKHPDALKFVYTRDGKDKKDESVVLVYSWKGTWTQASVPSNTAVGVFSWGSATKVNMTDRDVNILGREHILGGAVTKSADAELIAVGEKKITGSQADWTEVIVPIEYKSNNTPEKMNIVISAAGYQSDASITDGVNITIDDVEFVYNSELKSASYNGTELSFNKACCAYVEGEYNESNLELELSGVAATCEKTYNAANKVLTIVVKGENIEEDDENYNEYYVRFGSAPFTPCVVSTKIYNVPIFVGVDGDVTGPQSAGVAVEKYDNGNINLVLKNFILGEGEESMPVGNIALNNITVNDDNTFTYNGGVKIENGDDSNVDWMGPTITSIVGEIPLEAECEFVGKKEIYGNIDINLSAFSLGMINVKLGYDSYASMNITEAGYATFVAPFDVKVPEGVTAYSCAEINADLELVLEEVQNTIPANTPVIVEGAEFAESFFAEEAEPANNPTCGLLTGVYAETAAPVGSYVLQQQGEKIAFFKVASDGIMVGANRAYLTVASNAKALNFTTAATAINAVNALVSGKAEVYGANGARQNGLQKGMNIVKMADGSVQKVLVK